MFITLALSDLNLNAIWFMGIGLLFLLQGLFVLNLFLKNSITIERIGPVVKNALAVSAYIHTSMFCSLFFLSSNNDHENY